MNRTIETVTCFQNEYIIYVMLPGSEQISTLVERIFFGFLSSFYAHISITIDFYKNMCTFLERSRFGVHAIINFRK